MAIGQCTRLGIKIDPIERNIYKETQDNLHTHIHKKGNKEINAMIS